MVFELILEKRLIKVLDTYIAEHRALVVGCSLNWWDKYRVSLPEVDVSD
jgi:hypothetical protein